MWGVGGHLGSTVSALVDGQLDQESTERSWAHVLECSECRRLVERETWVKRRLSAIDGGDPPAQLLGSLYGLGHTPDEGVPSWDARPSWLGLDAWAAVDRIEQKGRGRRRAALALVGAGSVSVVVLGFVALGGVTSGAGEDPAGPPEAALTGPASGLGPTSGDTPTTAVVAPAASVHGTLPSPWRTPAPSRDAARNRGDVLLLGR
jgi:hypothetical protein